MHNLNPGPEVIDHADLPISEEEKALIALVRQLSFENFRPRAAQYDEENTFPAGNFEDLKRHGLMTLKVPKQYGGKGVSDLAYAAVVFEIAKGDPATALCFTMHSTAMTFIEHLATPEQKAHFYRPVVEQGAKFSAFGSEPQASIFAGQLPRSTLTRTPEGFLLRGKKAWCSLGGNSDYAFVNATLDNAVLGVVVPMSSPHIVPHADWNTLAMRGTQSVSIDFNGVLVPEENVIRSPLNVLLEMEYGVGLCAAYMGLAESAYRYAREVARESMKRILASEAGHGHPDAGRLFSSTGEMRISLLPAWLMVKRAATAGPVGTFQRSWAVAEAKQVVGELAAKLTAQTLRVVGARSLSKELPVERLFRDAQAGLVMAIKPDHAAYLAGRFELGVLPSGMSVDVNPSGFAISPEALRQKP